MGKPLSNLAILERLQKRIQQTEKEMPSLGNHFIITKAEMRAEMRSLEGALNQMRFIQENGGFANICDLANKQIIASGSQLETDFATRNEA